jgi:DNA-binding response OmpR family regulator
MYQRALQPEYEVWVASSEAEVSSLLKAHTVHAIVLEPGPVGGSGWALLADLKQRPDLSSIPLIICTAQDERSRGLKLGVTAYLVKPVLPATLLETVRHLAPPSISEGEQL